MQPSSPGATEAGASAAPSPVASPTAEDAGLQAVHARLDALARGMSHDLRAPLRAIEGFARQVARDPTAEEVPAQLERIRQAAARMGGLIDALVELMRLDGVPLRPAPVDLGLLADWVAAELHDAQPEPPLRLEVQDDLGVVGDERLLKLLLQQLLRNARQFAGGGEARVEIAGERRGDALHLRVRDHGIGFDMAHAGKLFQPFQRLHGRDEGAGDGLGLAIAQRVAARHHGALSAEARPGDGATFHVVLRDAQ